MTPMKRNILSIVVLSYNRPEQIRRILERLSSADCRGFDLIVKDDCSPRQSVIKAITESFNRDVSFDVVFYANKENLGYDKNLYDAFNITSSDYVFLLSDDDYVEGAHLEALLDILKIGDNAVYFTPYYSGNTVNRCGLSNYSPKKFYNVIYNSILFSGLIFRRRDVLALECDKTFLSNCIYTQVYLASVLIYHEKKFGMAPIGLLHLGGDGENFFGKNQSATNKEVLQDRESIIANLNYQSFLIKVVKKISDKTNRYIYTSFLKQYNKRLVSYAFRARIAGDEKFCEFVSYLSECNRDIPFYVRASFIPIKMLPVQFIRVTHKFFLRYLRRSG